MCTKFQSKSGLNEEEIENATENEYCYLLRRHRMMENDRAAFTSEVASIIRKQRVLIASLRADKKELMTKVVVATGHAFEEANDHVSDALVECLKVSDKNDEEIVKLKQHVIEIEKEVNRTERLVMKLRLKDVTDTQSQEKAIKSQRTVSNLENRLYIASCRFNKVVAENHELREEINHMLWERIKFNEAFYTLIGKLNEGKKCMLDLIELATLAYDQREEALGTLNSLEEKAASHLATQSHEMSVLEQTMDDDLKLRDFLESKGQRRIMAELESKRDMQREQKRKQIEALIEQYEKFMEEIREYSGESDIDILAKSFLKTEEENFSMFLYVIHVNDEVEDLHAQVQEYQSKIQLHRALGLSRAKVQKERLNQLTDILTEKKNRVKESEATIKKRKSFLERLMKGVNQLFKEVKANRALIQFRLGDNARVTRHNFISHLQEIECKITKLMNQVYYIERRTNVSKLPVGDKLVRDEHRPKFKAAPVDVVAPTQPCALCVEQEEMSKLEEVEINPLSRKELEEKLKRDQAIPDFSNRLHNLSACRLPRSRKILQRRYM